MKLLITTPFEVDYILVDVIPSYVKMQLNLVSQQTIELNSSAMQSLLTLLNYSSETFDVDNLQVIDENTIQWS